MAAFGLFIFWVILNVGFVIPAAIVLFYTINAVLPVLAAVEDLDSPKYELLGLDETNDGDSRERSTQGVTYGIEAKAAVSSSVRSMMRMLYSARRWLPLVRGFGWLLVWNITKCLILVLAYKIPSEIGFLAQILLPLPFLPIHTLWVHTILSRPSSLRLSKRFAPIKQTLRAVALPMSILLTAEATTQRILWQTYKSIGLRWEDFAPLPAYGSDNRKAILFCLLGAVLMHTLIVPAHLLLVRIEASLLPMDEQTIIIIDPALTASQQEGGYLTLMEALKSLKRPVVVNVALLYFKLIFLTSVVVTIVGYIDSMIYIFIALSNWEF